jgi:hypothetical protein
VRRPPAGIAAGAATGVGGDLSDLHHIAELVGLAQLALADRASVRVGQRHQPVSDLLATGSLLDLGDDALATVSELLQLLSGAQLGPGAAPTRGRACLGGQRPRLPDRTSHRLPGLGIELQDLLHALAGPPAQGLGDRPHQLADRRERSTTRLVWPRSRPASLRPWRASARAPCQASTPSVG